MKPKLKEDPKEWRKTAWMTLMGLAVLSSVLRWRHVLPTATWAAALCVFASLAAAAAIQPRWFRGYYRFSAKLGFKLSQTGGNIILSCLFFAIITPLGWVMRMTGKDPLRLRRPSPTGSYWSKAPPKSSLDRLF